MMRQVLSTHTSLSRGALKRFTFESSPSASCNDASTWIRSEMSRCSGLINVRRAAMRLERRASTRLSSGIAAKVRGWSFVMRYFSSPSPDASSSSCVASRHMGCPRNALSVVQRNS